MKIISVILAVLLITTFFPVNCIAIEYNIKNNDMQYESISQDEKQKKLNQLIKISQQTNISEEKIFKLSYMCYEITDGGENLTFKSEVLEIFQNISDKLNKYYWTYFENIDFNEIKTFYLLKKDESEKIDCDLVDLARSTNSFNVASEILSMKDGIRYAFYLLENENIEIKELAQNKLLAIAPCIEIAEVFNEYDYAIKPEKVSNEFAIQFANKLIKNSKIRNDIAYFYFFVMPGFEEVRKIGISNILNLIENEDLDYIDIEDIAIFVLNDVQSDEAMKIAKHLIIYQGDKIDEDIIIHLISTPHNEVNALFYNLLLNLID